MKYYFFVLILLLFHSCVRKKSIEYSTDCTDIEVESDIGYILEMNSAYFNANDIELVSLKNDTESCIIILKYGSRELRIKEIPTDIELLETIKEFYKEK